ncbi:MAG TPA: PAS domain-containing sensor histidine kinase [Polyangiales bacterium]|nr:PAS domain-containing sensor histidine kinase [Polyangiales bacterium]
MSADDPFDSAPCGLLVTEDSGLIARVNQTLCTWLQRPAESMVRAQRFQDMLTMGCRIFHQTHWMPLLQMQGSVAEVQLELKLPDGSVLPVLANAIRDPAGTKTEIALFITHDRRKYEQELLLARRRAEEALENERRAQTTLAELLRKQEAEAKARAQLAEQLIGIVSHDLRTPLNAIVLGASLLGANEVSAAQKRTVTRITSAANRATRLIADLLDFTQARVGGGLRVNDGPLDLHAVVAECVEELRLAWPGRMIEHTTVGVGCGRGDADRVAQVVTNLVTNALTYGTPNQPVTVESASLDQALRLRVHNRGEPIPEALRPQIFEPLRRGEQQVKLGSRSVGLGLYIVQQIALAHGGHVDLSSSAEAGTAFSVTFPHSGGQGHAPREQPTRG